MSWRVEQGDCLEVMRTFEASSFHAIVTDPPYSSGTRKEGQKGVRRSMTRTDDDESWFDGDSFTVQGFGYLLRECGREWKRLLIPGGHAFVFIDWRMYPHLAAAIESADLRHVGCLVWDKAMIGMGSCFRNQHEFILHFTKGMGREPFRRDVSNVLRFCSIRDGEHPTEKPVPLLKQLLAVVTEPGDWVLDCFAGSGATLEAAESLERNAVGIESSEGYVRLIEARMRTVTPSLFGATGQP